jgi:hypothetical protein
MLKPPVPKRRLTIPLILARKTACVDVTKSEPLGRQTLRKRQRCGHQFSESAMAGARPKRSAPSGLLLTD